MEQFNQCDGGHADKGEIRKYPIGGGGNMFICRDCYNKHRAIEIKKQRPVYDWATLEIVQPKIEPPKPTEAEIASALVVLGEKLDEYDWVGTRVDDAWSDHITPIFHDILVEEGMWDFFHDADEDYEVLGRADHLIGSKIAAWLMDCYKPEAGSG